MNARKMALSGVLGFAVGAGLMMMPNSNKWRRTVLQETEKLRRAMRHR